LVVELPRIANERRISIALFGGAVRKTGCLHIAVLALFMALATVNSYSETNTNFSVVTTEATAITLNSAELPWVVSPAGSETGVWFEWGTSNTLGSRSDVNMIAPGTTPVSFALSIKDLQPHTTYYFRAVAYRAATTMPGDIRQFTTSGDVTTPTNTLEVNTAAATSVTSNSATLHGRRIAQFMGRVDVFDNTGNPLPVKLNGETRSSFTYSIPVGGTFVLAPRDSNGQSPL
jgi:hypothetical protein